MTKRIFRSICLVAFAIFLACLSLIMGVLYDYFSKAQQNQLKMETELAAQGIQQQGTAYFQGLDIHGYRLTWIDRDGTVLCDSNSDATGMENHLEREEVKEAMESGYGLSDRYSTTLTDRQLYAAKRLDDGTVVRISCRQSTVLTLLLGMAQPICIIIAVALGLSLLLAHRLSRRIVQPLNQLNLDQPLSNAEYYDELMPLLLRITSQQKQLHKQEHILNRQREEFETVTRNMREGLVLLNWRGTILSINHTAAALFGTTRDCIGKDILTVNRTLSIQDLLENVTAGRPAEKKLVIGDSSYQVDASPILTGNVVTGAVLLLFDITEKEQAEQMRREFTANVSHELRTPLHTISGSAELLCSGLVSPEDVPRFTTQIYTEAQRMIQLVEDTINLSHLDEGSSEMEFEPVDLYAVAETTVESLRSAADAAGVTMTLEGESTTIPGIPQLLRGIAYNLCENAIKYNREQGSVHIRISRTAEGVEFSVRDTGIGIPPEHQNRIFERFYRVDKSRSKAVGGTGLGLSIVKHAAKIHRAKINVQSVQNEGTTIAVVFPAS